MSRRSQVHFRDALVAIVIAVAMTSAVPAAADEERSGVATIDLTYVGSTMWSGMDDVDTAQFVQIGRRMEKFCN